MIEEGAAPERPSDHSLAELLDVLPQLVLGGQADGAVDYCNQAWTDWTGRPRETAIGWEWLGAVHCDDRAEVEAAWRAVIASGQAGSVDFRLRARDGTDKQLRAEIVPIADGTGGVSRWVAAARDASEHCLARPAQAELESRYRAFVQGFQGIAFRFTRAFRLVLCQGAVEPITGYTEDELIRGTPGWESLIHPEDLPAVRDENQRMLHAANGFSHVREYRIVRKDGQVRWVHEVVQVAGETAGTSAWVQGVLYDITAQKTAEQSLRDSEERLRQLVDHAIIGIFRTTPEGRLLMANPAMVRLIGAASAEDLASEDFNLLARRLGYPRDEIRERLDRDGEVVGYETSWTRLDGVKIHVRENVRAVRDSSGRVVCWDGTIEDLTSHEQLEEQLRRAQKMEAIGRLAGGVAHGFNNLMQTMFSLTALLRSARENVARHEELLGELEEQVSRGSALTRQLLLFSRRDIARLERLDLNAVITASSSLLSRIVRENVRFSLALDPRPLKVSADHGQLDQVLLNLVLNASEAMPEGGELCISSGAQGQEVWFEVSDQGCGITNEQLERIFEPFFTTKEAENATGLGLAVSHGIVSALKGRIEVRSTVSKGSSFRVTLPAEALSEEVATPAVASAFRGVEGQGELVMVVEDEPGARQGLRAVLEMIGYRVRVAAAGEEALAMPVEPAFDVLLSDVLLPGIHGAELARRLQERWPRMRVLLMSGYAEDESLRRGLGDIQVRFLAKPFDMVTLAKELRATLATR